MKTCIQLLRKAELLNGKVQCTIFFGKTDVQSAFHLVPFGKDQFCWVIMKAYHPETKQVFYFVDKCLPFGASISCALFQAFSDVLYSIFEFSVGSLDVTTNYLDDFLFIALTLLACNQRISKFLQICQEIGCRIAKEKTVWGMTRIIFLGTLLDGDSHCICIPIEKKEKAIYQIKLILGKRKATIREIQSITGLLNFLNRAIVPGRAFTRRMYSKLQLKDSEGQPLKQYHHVVIDAEFN